MMDKKQIDLFYDMACLYEYVGELNVDEDIMLEQIQKMYGYGEFNAINVLFNEEGYQSANMAFKDLFGLDKEQLNRLADEFGYMKVGGV